MADVEGSDPTKHAAVIAAQEQFEEQLTDDDAEELLEICVTLAETTEDYRAI
jgi:hypothetical protein